MTLDVGVCFVVALLPPEAGKSVMTFVGDFVGVDVLFGVGVGVFVGVGVEVLVGVEVEVGVEVGVSVTSAVGSGVGVGSVIEKVSEFESSAGELELPV